MSFNLLPPLGKVNQHRQERSSNLIGEQKRDSHRVQTLGMLPGFGLFLFPGLYACKVCKIKVNKLVPLEMGTKCKNPDDR